MKCDTWFFLRAQAKSAAAEAAAAAARSEAASLAEQLAGAQRQLEDGREALAAAQSAARSAAESAAALAAAREASLRSEADGLRQAKAVAEGALAAARLEFECRLAEAEASGGPPAMAGPGFRWVLVREDEPPSPMHAGAAPAAASAADAVADAAGDTAHLAVAAQPHEVSSPAWLRDAYSSGASSRRASDRDGGAAGDGSVDVASMLAAGAPSPRLSRHSSAAAGGPLESEHWRSVLRQKQGEAAALARQVRCSIPCPHLSMSTFVHVHI